MTSKLIYAEENLEACWSLLKSVLNKKRYLFSDLPNIRSEIWGQSFTHDVFFSKKRFVLVHLGAGLWAVLAGPIFKRNDGILYNGSRESFELFGWHLLGALAIFVWAGLALFIILIAFVCIGCAKYKSSDGKLEFL